MDTRTTRLPVDLLDTAEVEGREEHRSAAKQIEHWARFGMFFDRQTSSARRRVQRAVAGEVPLGGLSTDEQLTANALIDASISAAANSSSFADRLAARGTTTITMTADGQLLRREPDGTTTPL
jgi:hypothetical protein